MSFIQLNLSITTKIYFLFYYFCLVGFYLGSTQSVLTSIPNAYSSSSPGMVRFALRILAAFTIFCHLSLNCNASLRSLIRRVYRSSRTTPIHLLSGLVPCVFYYNAILTVSFPPTTHCLV